MRKNVSVATLSKMTSIELTKLLEEITREKSARKQKSSKKKKLSKGSPPHLRCYQGRTEIAFCRLSNKELNILMKSMRDYAKHRRMRARQSKALWRSGLWEHLLWQPFYFAFLGICDIISTYKNYWKRRQDNLLVKSAWNRQTQETLTYLPLRHF